MKGQKVDLKPVTWNAPEKPYHGKQAYADHILWADLQKFEQARALPKDESRRPMFLCPDCSGRVVWVRSKRTGRMYLCDTKHSKDKYGVGLYFDPSRPHFKSCSGN